MTVPKVLRGNLTSAGLLRRTAEAPKVDFPAQSPSEQSGAAGFSTEIQPEVPEEDFLL